MALKQLRGALASACLACLAYAAPAQAANTFYDLGTLPAPAAGATQMVYSSAYNSLVVMNSGSTITTVNLTTQATSTHQANATFTDIEASPSGRYVYAADYGGENTGYGTPAHQSYVHRLDLTTGAWSVETVYIAGHVAPMSDTTFALESLNQWISIGLYQWSGAGAATNLSMAGLEQGGSPMEYEGNFRYVPSSSRLLFGNSGNSSDELSAYKVNGTALVAQEGSGAYGSAQGYGGTLVLSTDQSALYYGRLAVSALNVASNLQTFPENIVAANGSVAFGAASYYNPKTAAVLGSLGISTTVYALDPHTNDFWVYDPTAKQLHHFSATPVPHTVLPALSGLAVACPASVQTGQPGVCTATASYVDGSTQAVTPTWTSSNTAALTVDSQGNLTALSVTTATNVTVTASYTAAGITETQTASISVVPPHILNALTLSCPGTLASGQTGTCSATAGFTDGSTQGVTPTWTSASPTLLAIGSSGNLTAQTVTAATPVTISASYTAAGVTETQTASVTVSPLPPQPASIKLASASSSGISATIAPSPADVGKTESVWMAAVYDGTMFMRNGANWQAYTSGALPVAIPSLTLTSSNLVNVVSQMDISSLVGLQLYVGFGTSANDMLTGAGKLALIYTVPVPVLIGISLKSASIAVGGETQISPIPLAASLGTCTSSNSSVASVAGNFVNGVNAGTASITCNGQSTLITVTPDALTSISLQSPTLAVGSETVIVPQPANATLGICTTSNAGVATVSGNQVTAVASGTATITCNGQSTTVTVPTPSCQQATAGTYSGNISGGYSGTASLTLTQQPGSSLYNVSGSLSINGLGTVNAGGQSQPPAINLEGYCASGGSTFQCFSASGTLSNGSINGSYSTVNGQSGSFSLSKVCS